MSSGVFGAAAAAVPAAAAGCSRSGLNLRAAVGSLCLAAAVLAVDLGWIQSGAMHSMHGESSRRKLHHRPGESREQAGDCSPADLGCECRTIFQKFQFFDQSSSIIATFCVDL